MEANNGLQLEAAKTGAQAADNPASAAEASGGDTNQLDAGCGPKAIGRSPLRRRGLGPARTRPERRPARA